mgnify:CR=1 FL=1
MYYYRYEETVFASLLPDLPLETADRPAAGTPGLFLIDRDPVSGRSSFCVSDARQLTARVMGSRSLAATYSISVM